MGFIQVYNGNLKHVATKDRKEEFMSPYANLRGNSPVVGYEIEATRKPCGSKAVNHILIATTKQEGKTWKK